MPSGVPSANHATFQAPLQAANRQHRKKLSAAPPLTSHRPGPDPNVSLPGRQALFCRPADAVIAATAFRPRLRRRRPAAGAFPHARSVPDRRDYIVKVCPSEADRPGRFLPIPSGNCRRGPRERHAADGAQPPSPSASRSKPGNAMRFRSNFCPSRRRPEAARTRAPPGSADRRSSMEPLPVGRLRCRGGHRSPARKDGRCAWDRAGPVGEGRPTACPAGYGPGGLGSAPVMSLIGHARVSMKRTGSPAATSCPSHALPAVG